MTELEITLNDLTVRYWAKKIQKHVEVCFLTKDLLCFVLIHVRGDDWEYNAWEKH